MQGLMKSHQRKQQLSGGWDEELDTCIAILDTLPVMDAVTDEQKLRTLPVMLLGDALR